MWRITFTLIALTTLISAGCTLPPNTTKTTESAEKSPSMRNGMLADERYVALGTVPIAIPQGPAMSQTWYIDKATNRIIVCRLLANMANFICSPHALP